MHDWVSPEVEVGDVLAVHSTPATGADSDGSMINVHMTDNSLDIASTTQEPQAAVDSRPFPTP